MQNSAVIAELGRKHVDQTIRPAHRAAAPGPKRVVEGAVCTSPRPADRGATTAIPARIAAAGAAGAAAVVITVSGGIAGGHAPLLRPVRGPHCETTERSPPAKRRSGDVVPTRRGTAHANSVIKTGVGKVWGREEGAKGSRKGAKK